MSKLNISIDVSDLLIEKDDGGEWDLETELREIVSSEIRHKLAGIVRESMQDEIAKQTSDSLRELLGGAFKKVIEDKVQTNLLTLEVRKASYSKEMVPFADFVRSECDKHFSSAVDRNIAKTIELQTTEAITRLQEQYNSVFATSIITKLHEAGFLSDKASSILLVDKKEKE